MPTALASFVRRFGEKRFVLLLLSPGFLLLAFDVAADHFADGVVEHPAQVPGTISPVVCALLLLATALPRPGPVRFRRLSLVTGWLSLVTGALGVFFHLGELVEMSDGWSWEGFLETLTVAPPVFAPAAFVGLGALLLVVASPRVGISVVAEAESEQAAVAQAG